MRNIAISVLAGMVVMGTSNFAFAWSDVSGTINKVNIKTHEIVLDTGQTYFVEIFTWRDGAIPDHAPPAIQIHLDRDEQAGRRPRHRDRGGHAVLISRRA